MKLLKGQSSLEYLALITIILGVFLGIGTYFKRGVQGRWKEAVDGMGDQYDPRVTNTDITERVQGFQSTVIETIPVNGGVWTMRDDNSNMLEEKFGSTTVAAY